MKIDWSNVLIAAMIMFILFIVSLSVKMATSSYALYEDDYYEQGEIYNERMKMEKIGESVSADYIVDLNTLELNFKKAGVVTEVRLVFLADHEQDLSLRPSESLAKNRIVIPFEKELKSGIWYMEISGNSEGKPFFKKQQFIR